MTKIDIVSGFLGAGKTTLIKKLLAEAFQGVLTVYLKFYDVGMFCFQSLHLLKITGTGLQGKTGMFVIKAIGQQQYAAVEQ